MMKFSQNDDTPISVAGIEICVSWEQSGDQGNKAPR